jgi:eukaryotic-like serine/threonine-protein kinase
LLRQLENYGVEGRREAAHFKTQMSKPQQQIPRWVWGLLGGMVMVGIVISQIIGNANPPATPEPRTEIVEIIVTATPIPTVTQKLGPTKTKTPEPPSTQSKTSVLPSSTPETPTIIPTPITTSSPLSGATKVSQIDGMVLVYIPEGNFNMGADSEQHIVYLDAYWIDRTEVTNAMYNKCVIEKHCDLPNTIYYDPESLGDHPVVYIEWYQAKAYCEYAGRHLPTEAEWEKAARGNDGRKYPWGNDYNCKNANLDDETLIDGYTTSDVGCDGFNKTAPVGSFPQGASFYGILDLSGNVWEWVADWYSYDYYETSPMNNPIGPEMGNYRVLRGGSWLGGASTTYERYSRVPYYDTYDIGFRCSQDASP